MMKWKTFTKVSLALAVIAGIASWPVASAMSSESIHPVASGVATIAGILLGCIIAAMTILVTSSENALIRNIGLTGGLKQLIGNLNDTMLSLVSTSAIFLVVLFIPDSVILFTFKLNSAFVSFGVGMMTMAFMLFFYSWHKFKQVASMM